MKTLQLLIAVAALLAGAAISVRAQQVCTTHCNYDRTQCTTICS